MRALLTVALLLAVFAAPGAAADTDTMFKIRRASTIIIGYSEAAKPFSFLGPDGKPAGYSVDLCREIAAGIQRERQKLACSLYLGGRKIWRAERTSRPRPRKAAGGPSVPQADRGRPEAWGERILASQRTERDRDLSPPRTAKLLAEHVAVGLRCSRRDPKTTC